MNSFLRKTALGAALAVALAANAFAAGADVNATSTGLALRGYDAVSYHTMGKPEQGNFQITAEYEGAVYRFANEANRDAFKADPAKYAPQFGGYCAMGAAFGKKFDGDPNVWKIVDSKLYLNLAPEIAAKWQSDTPKFIQDANANWTKIKDKPAAELN
jgi:YHS domain-containing protein